MDIAIEIIGTLVGLLYIYLEYKASIYLWIASIIMPAIYIYVYYQAGLYADFGINIYYLVAAIYGWTTWKWGTKKSKNKNPDIHSEEVLPITHFPWRGLPAVGFVFLGLFFLIATILIIYTDSDVPWLNSFTTALSIIGMWMLAKKYVEQWLVWIVVDAVCIGLYLYKDLYFTSALYTLYTVIAFAGYKNWLSIMNPHSKTSINENGN